MVYLRLIHHHEYPFRALNIFFHYTIKPSSNLQNSYKTLFTNNLKRDVLELVITNTEELWKILSLSAFSPSLFFLVLAQRLKNAGMMSLKSAKSKRTESFSPSFWSVYVFSPLRSAAISAITEVIAAGCLISTIRPRFPYISSSFFRSVFSAITHKMRFPRFLAVLYSTRQT